MSSNPISRIFIKNWKDLKEICYWLVVIINIAYFVTRDDESGESHQTINFISGIIVTVQIALTSLILIFCAIERYPITINAGLTNNT